LNFLAYVAHVGDEMLVACHVSRIFIFHFSFFIFVSLK
jgi:hypothetical protein